MKRYIVLALVSCTLTVLPQALAQTLQPNQPAAPGKTPGDKPAAQNTPPANPSDSSGTPHNPAATCLDASACLPGDKVKVNATGPSLSQKQTKNVAVTLRPSKTTGEPLTAAAKWDGASLLVEIPQNAPDDRYSFQIEADSSTNPNLTDLNPSQVVVQRPTITGVSPAAAFTDTAGASQVIVLGSGFWRGTNISETLPTDDQKKQANGFVELRYKEIGTPARCAVDATSAQKRGCYDLNVDSDRQVTLTFYKLDAIADPIKGAQSFVLAVRNVETNRTALTLIDTTQSTPLTVAVVGFLLIVVIVYLLLRSGEHATKQRMNGKDYWLSVLFYDVQTNSYSLSKCQFYAWTAAAVIGYLFLAISKSFVQGSAIFPDIPPGIPTILIASVGTVVLSNGITSAKGDKGAGAQGPNLSDFIASGGVVAPDRLQFAIWTVVGIGTFLAIVFQSDPRNINDLPAIPLGFLKLMGISSSGYLAGKLARKAGPTIAAMVIKSDGDMLRFQLTGSGLSRSAIFSIDEKPIFPDLILGKDGKTGLPEVLQQDPSITDTDYARILTFPIKDYPDSWLGGPHNFTITNPDSQKATKSYQKFLVKPDSIKITAAPPAPPPATPPPATTTPTPPAPNFVMTGECLDSDLAVTCTVTPSTGATNVIKQFPVTRTDLKKKDSTGAEVPPANIYNGTVTGLNKGDVVVVSITDASGFIKKIEPVTVA